MNKLLVLGAVIIIFAVTLVLAQEASTKYIGGYIIDNMCAGIQTPEQLSEFVKSHAKECAAAPQCAASGYSLFANNKLYKFTKGSVPKIEAFLKKKNSKLQVVVEVMYIGEELSLISIKNQ